MLQVPRNARKFSIEIKTYDLFLAIFLPYELCIYCVIQLKVNVIYMYFR